MGSGEEKLAPKAKDPDLCILMWEELHRVQQEGTLLEVEHVKAHPSKKVRNNKCRTSNIFFTQTT